MKKKENQGVAKAPMRVESYKRFGIHKKEPERSWIDFFIDWIVKGVIVGLLISINFVLFASSSNYSMFAEGLYVIPNIILPIICIFSLSLGAMFLISFSSILENLLVSFVAGMFVFVTINQFMMLSPDSFLYSIFYNISTSLANNFISGSDVIAAVVVAIVVFLFLLAVGNRGVFILALTLFIAFGAIIADEYINQRNKTEFVTLFERSLSTADAKGKKFIYIMLPNAASYRYLSEIGEDEISVKDVKKTKELMLGFFANNDFTLYSNAYVEDDDQFMNIVSQFNILNNKESKDFIADKIMIDGYMKFKNHNEKTVYMDDNKLFDKFKNANYKINVYQSHGIDLCQRNKEIVADKCVEKQSRPFNFENMNLSEIQKTEFLLLQWINSMKLFNDLSDMYAFINIFTDANKVALVGISYDNLYVINSVNTFDIMLNDILSETANTTYFALIDIPGEMYVYDEFCNIKPASEWLAKENLPWVKTSNLGSRRTAYMEQTNCLYGKLQEFINKLKEYKVDEDSVVVIQGISGFNDKKNTDSFIDNFSSKRSVVMAIKEPKKKRFEIDYDICPVSSFLIKYLYGKNICQYLDEFEVSQSVKVDIYNKMNAGKVTDEQIDEAKSLFANWYKNRPIKPQAKKILPDDANVIIMPEVVIDDAAIDNILEVKKPNAK